MQHWGSERKYASSDIMQRRYHRSANCTVWQIPLAGFQFLCRYLNTKLYIKVYQMFFSEQMWLWAEIMYNTAKIRGLLEPNYQISYVCV